MAKARAKKKAPKKARPSRKELAAAKRERKARAKSIRVATATLLKKARARIKSLEKHERKAASLARQRNPSAKAVGLLAARHAQLSGAAAHSRKEAKPQRKVAMSFAERVADAASKVPERDLFLGTPLIASVYDAGGFAGDMTLDAFKADLTALEKAALSKNPEHPSMILTRVDVVSALKPHQHELYERSAHKRRGLGSPQHLVNLNR